MKIDLDITSKLKQVYNYEKTIQTDRKALQIILYILAAVMLLIDEENYRLSKYRITILVLLAAIIFITLALLLQKYHSHLNIILKTGVFLLLLFSIPIGITGANEGFALLWFMLLPFLTILLIGLYFGIPVCILYGTFITLLFWTPIQQHLLYSYPRDFCFFYPIFYWGFCLMVSIIDVFYKLYQIQRSEYEQSLEKEVQLAVTETQNLMIASVSTISRMLDAKDSYTQEHSRRVAEYSRLIAQHLSSVSFSEEDLSIIYRSALMHDIGKIAIPDSILNKPARLSDEEYQIMKTHTTWGKEILSELKFLPQADLGANYHHEHYDGSGYPYGLSGEELPLMARIISAADALDAMNSNRCYRNQCVTDYIIREFEKGAGTQFDKEIADVVITLIKKGKIVVNPYENEN